MSDYGYGGGDRPGTREILQQMDSRVAAPRRLDSRKTAAMLRELLKGLFEDADSATFANLSAVAFNATEAVIGILEITGVLTATGSPVNLGGTTPVVTIGWGTGTPEGAVVANTGSIFMRTDGGAGTSFYVKETGDGTNTGWVGK